MGANMNKLTIIGDVHGHIDRYLRIIADCKESIQVGDMGLGFKGVFLPHVEQRHRFFRGNHDSPTLCRNHPNYLGDYGYDAERGIFWMAGASSIDRFMRMEGVSWWRDEELYGKDLDAAMRLYEKSKPRIVLSHECPKSANNALLNRLKGEYFLAKQECGASSTCKAMQVMLETWQPERWIFGHYHIDSEFTVPDVPTQFRCVAELSTCVLEV